jgi:uncharacterized protein
MQNACPQWANANLGNSPVFQTIDIGHETHVAVIQPDTAFWTLVRKEKLAGLLGSAEFVSAFQAKSAEFAKEMTDLRFNLKPSAVYFNPTERCNLNCTYCYIPDEMRKHGPHMSKEQVEDALQRLLAYFRATLPAGRKPQVVFHGSEPMLNREAVFHGIAKFKGDFHFGIQTNATLLDDEAIAFLKASKIGVGISIDGPLAGIADQNRRDWSGKGYFEQVVNVIGKLNDHPGFAVICTVTQDNLPHLKETAELFHERGVRTCMFNIVRCTQPRSRTVRPADDLATAQAYIECLEHTHALYKKTGRKMVVANFANILLAILAPASRRLMCDISPCGGARCFFALAANGDMFPCSEFVGIPEYKGANLFETPDAIPAAFASAPFQKVATRQTEKIPHCRTCAIQHFCGSPCPAEAANMNGGMDQPGAYCTFYQEQVRYAFRLIAEGRENDFLFDNWDKDTSVSFDASSFALA